MQFVIPPAAAEPIFNVLGFPVTNTMVNAWVAVVFFVVIAEMLSRRSAMVPRGLQNIAEGITEFMLGEIQKVTGDVKRARQFLPIIGSIFLLIVFSNWLGLLPGTGSVGFWEIHEGKKILLPFLRSAASDLNFTLAIAVFAVIASHVIGVRAVGAVSYFSKFFNVRGIIHALKKGPMAVIVAVIEFGVGLIEVISEIAKVVSLSLRLFGNVFAGEVLMTVMIGLFSLFLPIPFLFLEMLVGIIQATVFSMLTLAYLTVATTALHEDHEAEGIADEAEHRLEELKSTI